MHAGMDWRGLDDRAARGDQPVEAGALREGADRAGVRGAGADFRDRVEIAVDHRHVDARRERFEALVVAADARGQERRRGGEENDAGVEELATVDARHDAYDGVIKWIALAHRRRPPSIFAARRDGAADSGGRRRGVAATGPS